MVGIEQCQKKMISFINIFGDFMTPRNLHNLSLIEECADLREQEAAVKPLIMKYPIS